MRIGSETSVGAIVKENIRATQIFDKYKIDCCCGGDTPIEEVCRKAKVDPGAIIAELETVVGLNDPDTKYFNGLEPDELCDYIEKRHHSYVNGHLPFLQQKLQKLCDVHGANHPELFKVRELFEGSAGNLGAHMKKEELNLFPYIRKMCRFRKENLQTVNEFGEVFKIIDLMEEEHQSIMRTKGEQYDALK